MENAFYIQTDMTMDKYNQMLYNHHVALCHGQYQIECVCEVLGKPVSHQAFMKLFKENFYHSYKAYTHLENERLIKITPTYIKKWIYENGEAFEEIFDFQKKQYKKKMYIGV